MALTDQMIQDVVSRYVREYDRYVKLADVAYEKCQDIVHRKLTIRASVQRRAKHPNSLAEKLKKPDRRQQYNSVDEVFSKLSDLAGVRITTYVESDRKKVVAEIEKAFRAPTAPAAMVDVKDSNEKHYRATHCQVYLHEDAVTAERFNLKDTTCEIQVCSLLAHVFNEIEHDLEYKPLSGELSDRERNHLDQLGLLTKAGDITIALLLEDNERRLSDRTGEFIDVHDFVARVRTMLESTPDFPRNAGQLYDELVSLELDTPQKVQLAILEERPDPAADATDLVGKFSDYLGSISSSEQVEPETSDRLLVLLLERRCKEIVERHPGGRGMGRPSRLVYLARRFLEMEDRANAPANDAFRPAAGDGGV